MSGVIAMAAGMHRIPAPIPLISLGVLDADSSARPSASRLADMAAKVAAAHQGTVMSARKKDSGEDVTART